MSAVTYRHPTVDPEILAIIGDNYMIDANRLVVLSRKEHYFHQNASLTYLVEGYVECDVTARPLIFWYQMMHFPCSEQEWRVDIVPYTCDGTKMKELRDVSVSLVYGEPMPRVTNQ